MKRPAVFFDRDNTLIASDGYLGDPSGVVLVEGAPAALARVRALGFAVVTFSNQSGVARGMFPEEAVHAVNARLDEMLRDQDAGALIDRHEFCPFHPEAVVERYRQESDLRKPRAGMIYQAADRLGLDVSRSWVIGDAPRDIEAGHSAGCRTILFTDASLKPSPAAAGLSTVKPDFIVATLKEAVDIIEKTTMSDAPSQPAPEAEAKDNPQGAAAPAAADPAPAAEPHSGPGRKMTFAERVRAGTFQPARTASSVLVAASEKPKATVIAPGDRPAPAARRGAAEAAPAVRPTEPLSQSEQLEPLLQELLEEVRKIRQQQPYAEFSVSKLLAGIVQVLVLPALFFAYLHHDSPPQVQAMLLLATFLQTLTIALLVMGRQQ